MSNVIPFDPRFGTHTCEDPCHARAICEANRKAKTLEEMVETGEKLEYALGLGATPCQMVGFIGEMP